MWPDEGGHIFSYSASVWSDRIDGIFGVRGMFDLGRRLGLP